MVKKSPEINFKELEKKGYDPGQIIEILQDPTLAKKIQPAHSESATNIIADIETRSPQSISEPTSTSTPISIQSEYHFESQTERVQKKEIALNNFIRQPSTIIKIMKGELGLVDISDIFKMHSNKVREMLRAYYNQDDVGGPDFYDKYFSNRIKNNSNAREDKKDELLDFLKISGNKEKFESGELYPTQIYDEFKFSFYEDVITCIIATYGVRWANKMGFVLFPVPKDVKVANQILDRENIVIQGANVVDFNTDFRKQKSYPQKYKNDFGKIADAMVKDILKTKICDEILNCHSRTLNEIIYDPEFRNFLDKYAKENNIEEKEMKQILLKYLLVEDRIIIMRHDLTNQLEAIKSGEVTIYQSHLMEHYHLSLPPVVKILKELNIVTTGYESRVEPPNSEIKEIKEIKLEDKYPNDVYYEKFINAIANNLDITNPEKLSKALDDIPIYLLKEIVKKNDPNGWENFEQIELPQLKRYFKFKDQYPDILKMMSENSSIDSILEFLDPDFVLMFDREKFKQITASRQFIQFYENSDYKNIDIKNYNPIDSNTQNYNSKKELEYLMTSTVTHTNPKDIITNIDQTTIPESEEIEDPYPVDSYLPMFEKIYNKKPAIINDPEKLSFEMDDMPVEEIIEMLKKAGVYEKYYKVEDMYEKEKILQNKQIAEIDAKIKKQPKQINDELSQEKWKQSQKSVKESISDITDTKVADHDRIMADIDARLKDQQKQKDEAFLKKKIEAIQRSLDEKETKPKLSLVEIEADRMITAQNNLNKLKEKISVIENKLKTGNYSAKENISQESLSSIKDQYQKNKSEYINASIYHIKALILSKVGNESEEANVKIDMSINKFNNEISRQSEEIKTILTSRIALFQNEVFPKMKELVDAMIHSEDPTYIELLNDELINIKGLNPKDIEMIEKTIDGLELV